MRRVIKAAPRSRVFVGFSFADSAITPGLEDELTSIDVLHRPRGRCLLGRIELGYIKGFLQHYSTFSCTPTQR